MRDRILRVDVRLVRRYPRMLAPLTQNKASVILMKVRGMSVLAGALLLASNSMIANAQSEFYPAGTPYPAAPPNAMSYGGQVPAMVGGPAWGTVRDTISPSSGANVTGPEGAGAHTQSNRYPAGTPIYR